KALVLPHSNVVRSVEFSPDGARIMTSATDPIVHIWRADGGGEPVELRTTGNVLFATASWSADGHRIASGAFDGIARVWDADSLARLFELRGHENAVYSTIFSPDGSLIASGSMDMTLRLWKSDGTGEPRVLRGHTAVAALRGGRAFSPDGTRLVSHSYDGT